MGDDRVSSTVRRHVWDGLLEVARAVYYFNAQKNRYVRERNVSRFVQGIVATGAIVSPLGFLPYSQGLVALAGAFIGIVVIWNFVRDPESKAARLELVTGHQLPRLESRYRDLWERTMLGTVSDEEAQREKTALLTELGDVVSVLENIQDDEKLVVTTQRNAFNVEEQRYA